MKKETQADDKINELLTSPDTWENLQNDINEAKKTTLEKEKENEEPLKEESTSKKKKENFFEKAVKTKKVFGIPRPDWRISLNRIMIH